MKQSAPILILVAFALLAIGVIPYENPSGEAVAYAIAIRDGGPNPYNPNHLLIESAIRALYDLFSPGESLDRLTFLLFLARFGLLAYGLLTYALAAALFRSPATSLLVSWRLGALPHTPSSGSARMVTPCSSPTCHSSWGHVSKFQHGKRPERGSLSSRDLLTDSPYSFTSVTS